MKKAMHSTDRQDLTDFQQIKNIGPSIAEDFRRLKLKKPQDLIGKDPLKLYQKMCALDDMFYDPCVLDCFISAAEYINGKPPKVWWAYTAGRKKKYAHEVQRLRDKYKD
jgi:hypothetical protein